MVPTDELKDYPRRPRWWRIAIPVIAVGAVVVLLVLPADRQRTVPDFELPLLSGNGSLSSEELKGSPVVLNFFASWCVPCREEAPVLESAYRRYRDEGVAFVGVNIQDTRERARDFIDEFNITYPIVNDSDQSLAKDLEVVVGLPQTVFITSEWELGAVEAGDELGTIGGTTTLGAISREELDEQIERLLDD